MSAPMQALVLASVQRTPGWPEWRSLPAPSGAGRGVRSGSGRLSLQRLRRARLSLMLPGARRFVLGRSIAGGRSWATSAAGFPKVVIAAMADGGNDRAAPDRAPAIEVEFAGTARLSISALMPPEMAAAVIRALRR